MRSHRLTVKGLAILLLLVFCQKVGGGLYFHNWLHANACKQFSHMKGEAVKAYNCSCIDDFSMPFAEDAEKLSQPVPSVETEFISSYISLISFSATFYHSLRAPPSIS